MKVVKCPVCGAVDDVEIGDMYELDSFNSSSILTKYFGMCRECRTPLQWAEIYELVSVDDVKVIEL